MNINSLLSLGAVLLLSIMILNVNSNIFTSDDTMQDSKLGLLAVSIASSIIEEASKKAFDDQTANNSVTDVNLLKPPGDLGPGGAEVYPDYNDFDDFNNYTRHVSNIPSAEFDLSCKVVYVDPSDLDGTSLVRTWHKKIIVSVTSPSMHDTVTLSSVYSYWFFR